jgi:hypothetical protein
MLRTYESIHNQPQWWTVVTWYKNIQGRRLRFASGRASAASLKNFFARGG